MPGSRGASAPSPAAGEAETPARGMPGRARASGTDRGRAPGDDGATGAGGEAAAGEYGLYDRFNERLFTEVATRLGDPTYLIDSSKTARRNALRPLSLVRAGFGVRLVHLVRDGRGCMWSYVNKGSNRLLEEGREGAGARLRFAGLRSALSWRLANRAAEAFGSVYPDSYLRLRYEDFTADPPPSSTASVHSSDSTSHRRSQTLEHGRPFPRVHQVAGNRMRGKEIISLRPDLGWERELPRRYRALFRLLNGRMARGYGYSEVR